MSHFRHGFRSILPIISGIIPFGVVMGSAFAEAKLEFWQAALMDTVVYAGAAQLASVDLMKINAAVFVVVGTGLVINLRFLLYSAAMAPYLRHSSWWTKCFAAFTLTDQSYAALTANQEKLPTDQAVVEFYVGSATCMLLTWHLAVLAGYVFGNFAPMSWSLDYAIPLSFVALLMPTLKTRQHVMIALLSAGLSLAFYGLPLKTGIMATALMSMLVAWALICRGRAS